MCIVILLADLIETIKKCHSWSLRQRCGNYSFYKWYMCWKAGAGEGVRTLDFHLGKSTTAILTHLNGYYLSLKNIVFSLYDNKPIYTEIPWHCGKDAATADFLSTKVMVNPRRQK